MMMYSTMVHVADACHILSVCCPFRCEIEKVCLLLLLTDCYKIQVGGKLHRLSSCVEAQTSGSRNGRKMILNSQNRSTQRGFRQYSTISMQSIATGCSVVCYVFMQIHFILSLSLQYVDEERIANHSNSNFKLPRKNAA
jgi:hypothetical protein